MAKDEQYSYGIGVLHTNPGYYYRNRHVSLLEKKRQGPMYIKSNRAFLDVQKKIELLKIHEKKLYSQFGAKDYKTFIEKINCAVEKMNKDKEILEKFRSESISNDIIKNFPEKNAWKDETIKIRFTVKNPKDKKNWLQVGPNKKASTISFGIYPDVSKLKSKLNIMREKITKNMRDKGKIANSYERKASKFDPSSQAYESVREFLSTDFVDNIFDCFDVFIEENGISRSITDVNEVVDYLQFRHQIYGCTANEFVQMLSDPKQRKQAEKIIKDLEQEIISMGAGGSAELRDALRKTWVYFRSDINALKTFFTGRKLNSDLIGTYGEFFTVFFLNYIKNLFKGINPKLASFLVTDLNVLGEKIKTDVIWKAGTDRLGIQVKNYQTYHTQTETGVEKVRKEIEAKQHPFEFGEYFSNDLMANLCDFLANYFFHKTTQKMYGETFDILKSQLEIQFAAETLRLQYNRMENTDSFYLISGKYLVPGSEILTWYIDQNKKEFDDTSVSIYSNSVEPLPNSYDWKINNKYWKLDKNNYWAPTSEGYDLYQDMAYGNKITIKTQFKNFNLTPYSLY